MNTVSLNKNNAPSNLWATWRVAWSRWGEAWRVAVGAIAANRLRSGLTIIGVVVGVATVVIVAALLQGAQDFINDFGWTYARVEELAADEHRIIIRSSSRQRR